MGECLKKPVFMQGRATCVDEYIRFIKLLARQVKRGVGKPVLVFDGASAHTSLRSLEQVNQHFTPLQQAPYSSPFNPVETVWSLAKRQFQKRQLEHEGFINEEDFTQMVTDSCEAVSPAALRGVLLSHHSHIRKHLQAPAADADP